MHNACLVSMVKNPFGHPPSPGIRSPTLSGERASEKKKKETHLGPGNAITHTVDLRQVGLTVLDSHGWHKLGRLMANCRLLPGQKAVISEGRISLRRPCKFMAAQPLTTKSTHRASISGHKKIASDQKKQKPLTSN